ncbi:MAG: FG-GAP repeat-containing protein [Bacteroidetes bacterium]|nr:MAG: FG-GAP repeat-containing protein [Bacteroidota bacterium]
MLKSTALTILLILILFNQSDGQVVRVKSEANEWLTFPWTGGFDACQFGKMELNNDGRHDLLVFDRRGNRLSAFINAGTNGEMAWDFAPEMLADFPQLFDWVVFADYNDDGFQDIFTYSPGWAGIKVYKNTGSFPPSFDLVVFPYLTSLQGGGYINLLSTNADYPAIYDVDQDGDLDILNFWSLGSYIELHRNQSVEKYGHADSLDFKKTDFCWGRVAENEENNLLYLDSCLYNKSIATTLDGFRHRGATMLMHDFDNNGLPDLVLADVDYPGLTLLLNGGTVEEAFVIQQDTLFPSAFPVRLSSMPVAAFIDVNNDGNDDLLVSPFDPNPLVTENQQSIWLYLNEGSNQMPDFQLATKKFLQQETIDLGSGAYPVFEDVDGDGLKDIVSGNYGRYLRSWYSANTLHSEYESKLVYYRQVVTNNVSSFQLITNNFANLSTLQMKGFVPTFADFNNDGIKDMLVGSENGKLIYLTQGSQGEWMMESDFFSGIDVGNWSAPQLFDLNEDGVTDLIIGSQNGKIAYYRGISNENQINFDFVTEYLGGINVTDFNLSYDGYSVPCLFYDKQGDLRLVSGSEQGKLFLFDQIRGNLNGNFREVADWQTLLNETVTDIDVGMRSSAAIGELLNDGKLQMLAGNFSGGFQLFNGDADVAPAIMENYVVDFVLDPNPANNQVLLHLKGNQSEIATLQIINMQGKRLKSIEFKDQISLDVSQLKSGVYLFMLTVAEKRGIKKFVKY